MYASVAAQKQQMCTVQHEKIIVPMSEDVCHETKFGFTYLNKKRDALQNHKRSVGGDYARLCLKRSPI